MGKLIKMTEDQYVINKLRFDWTENEINFYRAVEKLTGGRVTSSRDGNTIKCHFNLVIDNQITLGQYIDRDALRHFGITSLTTRISAEMTVGGDNDKSSNWLVSSNNNLHVRDQNGSEYVCRMYNYVTCKNINSEFRKVVNDPGANLQNDKSGIAVMINALKEQSLKSIAPVIKERYRNVQFNRMACRILGIPESDDPSPEMQPFLSSLNNIREVYNYMTRGEHLSGMENHINEIISERDTYMRQHGKK